MMFLQKQVFARTLWQPTHLRGKIGGFNVGVWLWLMKTDFSLKDWVLPVEPWMAFWVLK
jgi:hypothetical protein